MHNEMNSTERERKERERTLTMSEKGKLGIAGTSRIGRREFLNRTAIGGVALAFPFVSRRSVLGANRKLNIAGIGVGGKGWVDITRCADANENIVALCDVDEDRAAKTFAQFPKAKRYVDYRKMFDEMGKTIDAVVVSTPDHMHFHPAMRAIAEGKHVFCQKPLTHTIYEARTLAEAARKANVATQMGNQGLSHPKQRRDAELILGGTIGAVRVIHIWTNRPGNWWTQAKPRPQDTPSIPWSLDWDLWLGCAPWRPYHPTYVPFHWRAFWDFGTGAIGDMGCHLLNLATLAMDVRDPIAVEAESEGANGETGPSSSHITWTFPKLGKQPEFTLHWYDGGKKPSQELFPAQEFEGNGVIMIGDKDTFYVPGYNGGGSFKSGATHDDYSDVPEIFNKRENWDQCHYDEWIEACKGGPSALSNFDVSGPVTEVVLLGNLAIRSGEKIDWDAAKMRSDSKQVNRWVRNSYRQGW